MWDRGRNEMGVLESMRERGRNEIDAIESIERQVYMCKLTIPGAKSQIESCWDAVT